MPFNTVNQYTGNHKPYDQVGNIIPQITHSEGISPHFEWQPAKWLPVQFRDKYYNNWFVIMPGKLVGCDQDGFLMPAGWCAGVAADTTVVYTTDDVAVGTIDIATGEAVTTAKTVTLTNLTGVKDPTWTAANAGVGAVTSGFMGRYGEAWAPADYPIGVCPYPIIQHPGGDAQNPANLTFHNYNMQHQVAVLCDYVIKLPLIPAVATTETLSAVWAASTMTFGTNDGWRNRTWIQATDRYNTTDGLYPCLATYEVAAIPLANFPVAKNTARTQFVCSSTTLLVNERTSMAGIQAIGDYWVDYTVGVVFVFSSGGSTLPITGGQTLTYYHYTGAVATYSRFGCVLSTTAELKPGDFLGCTATGNWIRLATPGPANTTANFANALGQVLGFITEPRGGLDRVRTAYVSINTDASGSMANATAGSASVNLGQMDQMPGTATGGVGSAIHYSGAADKLVVINLINR